LTRGLIAKLFHRRTLVHEPTLERIRNYFQSRGREIPFKCEIQAQYPEGALVIANDFGTAPGLLIELEHNPFNSSGEKALLIMLPGPPRELRPMFRDRVIPLLKEKLPNHQKHASITLKTACVGESLIEMEIAPKLEELVHQGLQIGYCAVWEKWI
jgi:nicotinamide-nucleotide amidase